MFGECSSAVQSGRVDRSKQRSRCRAIAAMVSLATLLSTATGGVAVARDGDPIELTSTVIVTKTLTPMPAPTKTLTPIVVKTLTPVTAPTCTLTPTTPHTLTPIAAPTYTLTPITPYTLTPVVLDPTPSPTPAS